MFPAYSGMPYWNNKYEDPGVDTESAYKLLREAGYRKSDTDGLWYYQDGTVLIAEAISPNDNFELRSVMRGVKQCLEAAGITVNLQELSDYEFDEKFDKKQYMLMPVQLELGAWTDIEKEYASYGENNYSFYSNSTVDGYFKQLKSLDEKTVVSAGYNAIEDLLMKDCPVVALYINYDSALVRSRLLGITRTSFSVWDPMADFYKWGITAADQESVPKEE
jgi:ABC-type transport system substrate-binding protein